MATTLEGTGPQTGEQHTQEGIEGTVQGSLVVVGGSERLDKQMRILRRYVELCDQAPGRRSIVIMTSATGHPDILGGEYLRIFHQLGWPSSELLMPPLANRDEAENERTADLIRHAAGIYITGGDQVALMDIITNTRTEQAMREAYIGGAIIGGTSAGATAMGNPMIARGGSGELRRGMVTLRAGLGMLGADIFVDTHFGQRGRFPRLVAAVAERPTTLGIGIDENTCLILGPNSSVCEVAGAGVIYFLDGRKAKQTTVDIGSPISMTPLALDVLTAGQHYDLAARKAVE